MKGLQVTLTGSTDTETGSTGTGAVAATQGGERTSAGLSGRRRGLATVATVAVVVAVLAQLPLIKNHIFYFWDDTASAFLPHWHYIGEQLRSGNWPWLNPDMWMGGNLAAEVMTGLFNPVSLANYIVVSLLPDLALSATLVKTEFLVILALGVYLLARDFGAGRRAAAVVAVAMPFSGYTLYFDAAAWAGGLIAFAYLPYVWWALRKFARGELNPLVVMLVGYLAMTAGNPYGALGVMVIVVAVCVEQAAQRQWRQFWTVGLLGALIGITTIMVYLPLVGSSAVTSRTSAGVTNDGFLVPNFGDLFGMSAPTYQPQYLAFGAYLLSFPSFYLAWFIMPLAPWLRWSALRYRVRARSSLLVFATVYLLFLFGPSNLWLFRWPSRLIEYAYLPILIAIAIVLDKGLNTSYARRRVLGSGLIIFAGAYLSWASTPHLVGWHVLATGLVVALLVGVLYTHRRRPGLYGGVLVLGTAVLLAVQSLLYTGNFNITPWRFPHDVAAMRAQFDQRYQGNTLQVMDVGKSNEKAPLTPEGVWRDLLPTTIVHTAGVDALNSYSGIGNVKFSSALCMTYYGATCGDAFRLIWQRAEGTDLTLAEVLRLQTVVVDPAFTVRQEDPATAVTEAGQPVDVPDGWQVTERTDLVTVYTRTAPRDWPEGRLSWAAPGVRPVLDEKVGESGERLRYQGQGRVVLAMLAWPGYRATVDGTAVDIQQGPAGLIQLDLPPAAAGGSTVELSFTPPGYGFGIPLMVGGLLVATGYGVWWQVHRGRRRSPRPPAAPAQAEPVSQAS